MSQETQLTQKKEGDYVCALFEPYRKEKKHLPTLQTYTYDMQTCTCNRRKNCITFRKKKNHRTYRENFHCNLAYFEQAVQLAMLLYTHLGTCRG